MNALELWNRVRAAAELLADVPHRPELDLSGTDYGCAFVREFARASGAELRATLYLHPGREPYVIEVANAMPSGVRVHIQARRPATAEDRDLPVFAEARHDWKANQAEVDAALGLCRRCHEKLPADGGRDGVCVDCALEADRLAEDDHPLDP